MHLPGRQKETNSGSLSINTGPMASDYYCWTSEFLSYWPRFASGISTIVEKWKERIMELIFETSEYSGMFVLVCNFNFFMQWQFQYIINVKMSSLKLKNRLKRDCHDYTCVSSNYINLIGAGLRNSCGSSARRITWWSEEEISSRTSS